MFSLNNLRFNATTSLIIINVVVFVVGMMARQDAIYSIPTPEGYSTSIFEVMGSYSWFNFAMEGEFWRVITYQFLHGGLGHLIFNMWALYFFGSAVEQIFGPKRFLAYYFVCGIAGALFASLIGGLGIISYGSGSLQEFNAIQNLIAYTDYVGEVSTWQLIPMVGASASIYGVMIAAAFLFPHAKVSLIFPPITMSLRTLVIVVIAIATLTIQFNGNNAGGEAGHLGGIIMGIILMIFIKRSLWKTRNW
ncbi:MAG: rhomboid family intramembrane serine protease [Akkermansia sp.]